MEEGCGEGRLGAGAELSLLDHQPEASKPLTGPGLCHSRENLCGMGVVASRGSGPGVWVGDCLVPQTQGDYLPWATAARLLLGLRRCGDLPILWMARLRLREARASKASACELDPEPSFILGCRVVSRADRGGPGQPEGGGVAGTGLSCGVGDGWVQGQTPAEDRQSHQGKRPVPSASGPGFPLPSPCWGRKGGSRSSLGQGRAGTPIPVRWRCGPLTQAFPSDGHSGVPGGQTAQMRCPVGFTV